MNKLILGAAASGAVLALITCGGSSGTTGGGGASASSSSSSSGASSSSGQSSSSSGASSSSSSSSSGQGGAGGMPPADPCDKALFCEKFDGYPNVQDVTDGQKFGPWHAQLKTPGSVMNLDGAHVKSGKSALHIHVDTNQTAGGRLFADGMQPLFQGNPTHLYGRMQMYIDPNGPSIHWTFFGLSGSADANSPAAGRRATYLMSSLPKNNVNTWSFVYGLEAQGNDPYHDCYFQSQTSMPSKTWTCVAFEFDSVARKLRMTEDAAMSPTVSVDDHGQGCVGQVPGDSPWYGPMVDQIYVGAYSFHPMVSPLDVWIDDVIVDSKPVPCQ